MEEEIVVRKKTCKRCNKDEPLSEFNKAGGSSKGRRPYCKICDTGKSRIWRLSHRTESQLYHRNRGLIRTFGITLDEYNEVFLNQGKVCAGCRGTNKNLKNLAVDHDHSTGKIRGLLCDTCNRAVGCVKDDPSTFRRLADYLEYSDSGLKVKDSGLK